MSNTGMYSLYIHGDNSPSVLTAESVIAGILGKQKQQVISAENAETIAPEADEKKFTLEDARAILLPEFLADAEIAFEKAKQEWLEIGQLALEDARAEWEQGAE